MKTTLTFEEKEKLLIKACEQKPFANIPEFPLSDYNWSFEEVDSKSELIRHLNEDYAIRNGFIYQNLAMVQQVNGGDEWLTFHLNENTKEYQSFESISFRQMQKNRSHEEIEVFINKLTDENYDTINTRPYNNKDCILGNRGHDIQNYTDKIVILKLSSLSESYQKPEYQLFYATGGFGCESASIGRAVYGYFLSDKENIRMNRENFIGVMKEECIPQWAKDTVADISLEREQESEQIAKSIEPQL